MFINKVDRERQIERSRTVEVCNVDCTTVVVLQLVVGRLLQREGLWVVADGTIPRSPRIAALIAPYPHTRTRHYLCFCFHSSLNHHHVSRDSLRRSNSLMNAFRVKNTSELIHSRATPRKYRTSNGNRESQLGTSITCDTMTHRDSRPPLSASKRQSI